MLKGNCYPTWMAPIYDCHARLGEGPATLEEAQHTRVGLRDAQQRKFLRLSASNLAIEYFAGGSADTSKILNNLFVAPSRSHY